MQNFERILEQFREYKQAVPTYGAILLDEDLTHVSSFICNVSLGKAFMYPFHIGSSRSRLLVEKLVGVPERQSKRRRRPSPLCSARSFRRNRFRHIEYNLTQRVFRNDRERSVDSTLPHTRCSPQYEIHTQNQERD